MSVNSINTNSAANVQQTSSLRKDAKEPTEVLPSQGANFQEDTVVLSSAKAQVDLSSVLRGSDLNEVSPAVGKVQKSQPEEGGYYAIDVSGSGGMIPPK